MIKLGKKKTLALLSFLLCFALSFSALLIFSPRDRQATSVFCVWDSKSEERPLYERVSAAHVCTYLLNDAWNNSTAIRKMIEGEQLPLTVLEVSEMISVKRTPNTVLLRLTVRHRDAETATKVANVYPSYLVEELKEALFIGPYEVLQLAENTESTFSVFRCFWLALLISALFVLFSFLLHFLVRYRHYRDLLRSKQAEKEEKKKHLYRAPLLHLIRANLFRLLLLFVCVSVVLGVSLTLFVPKSYRADRLTSVLVHESVSESMGDTLLKLNTEYFTSVGAYLKDPMLMGLFYQTLPQTYREKYILEDLLDMYSVRYEGYFGMISIAFSGKDPVDLEYLCGAYSDFAFAYVKDLLRLGYIRTMSDPIAEQESNLYRILLPIGSGFLVCAAYLWLSYQKQTQSLTALRMALQEQRQKEANETDSKE